MKKIASLMLPAILVAAFLVQAAPVQALAVQQEIPTPTAALSPADIPPANMPNPENVIPFPKIGFEQDSILRGPYDGIFFSFSLPSDWGLNTGGKLQMDIQTDFAYKGVSPTPQPELGWGSTYGGMVSIFLNEVLLSDVHIIGSGARTVVANIPAAALEPNKVTGQHELYISFDASETCYYDWTSTVTIKNTSVFDFPHNIVPISTNLITFPRPLYQTGSFDPQTAVLVVPDAPSPQELQASLAISSGLGRMTQNKLAVSLVPRSGLTDAIRQNNHLIFVGKPASLPEITQFQLPAPAKADSFDSPFIAATDGTVQQIVSPWNNSKVVLVVSGATDEGVYKAGQSVSSGSIRVGDQNNLSVISDINNLPSLGDVPVDRSFLDLGFNNLLFAGQGIVTRTIPFYIPAGKQISPDAYVEIAFSHSQVLDYDRSGMYVFLNDTPIATLQLSDETEGYNRQKFQLPPYTVRPGVNFLRVESEFWPLDECVDPRGENLWGLVTADSTLHIPFSLNVDKTPVVINLARYPAPYSADPSLRGTVFVLPPADAIAWNQAARLAYDLGNRNNSPRYDPQVVLANGNIENEENNNLFANTNVIMVGPPEMQMSLPSLNANMPAMFNESTGKVEERGSSILYRFPDGTSLGYLQMVQSIWNKSGAVLAVSGNTGEGLGWALDSLITPDTLNNLSGNLAAIRLDQVVVGDVTGYQNNAQGTSPNLTPVPVDTQATDTKPATPASYSWVLPALLVTVGLIVLILVLLLVRGMWRKPKA